MMHNPIIKICIITKNHSRIISTSLSFPTAFTTATKRKCILLRLHAYRTPGDALVMCLFHHLHNTLKNSWIILCCKRVLLTLTEKDDLVNLLMRHAGNSSNGAHRTDFHSGHSSQADMQSSMVQEQPRQHFQGQSTSTAAWVSAHCFPIPANGYLVNNSYNY
jgi:hypothetical protein